MESQLNEVGHTVVSDGCKFVRQILARIGDKWTVLIVMQLSAGPRRFNELRKQIGGVSQRMLTRSLRALERDGLITRTVFATNPPSVEYQLTELGRSLEDPIQRLGQWAVGNRDAIESAREKYDAENKE